MKVKLISHKGKQIFFADYSNIKDENEMLATLAEFNELVKKTSGDNLLSLSDITDASVSPDFMKEAKKTGKETIDRFEKTAVIGVTGLKGLLLKGYNKFSGDERKSFNTKEEALDYLTS